jgi:hypothetical protein
MTKQLPPRVMKSSSIIMKYATLQRSAGVNVKKGIAGTKLKS